MLSPSALCIFTFVTHIFIVSGRFHYHYYSFSPSEYTITIITLHVHHHHHNYCFVFTITFSPSPLLIFTIKLRFHEHHHITFTTRTHIRQHHRSYSPSNSTFSALEDSHHLHHTFPPLKDSHHHITIQSESHYQYIPSQQYRIEVTLIIIASPCSLSRTF